MLTIEVIISTALLVLIWIIQILHYPSFLFVDQTRFSHFEQFHTKRITYIVLPLMIAELGLVIFHFRPLVFGIVSLIWLSTFFLQVPCHEKLKRGFDEKVIRKLILTNWIRTLLWTIKFLVLVTT